MATTRKIINDFYNLDEKEKEKVIKELLDFNAKRKLLDKNISHKIIHKGCTINKLKTL
ncbi:TPA: hypothetical protein ACG3QY_001628 [Clostridioides difficile]